MYYIRLRWDSIMPNSGGQLGGEDNFVAAALDFQPSWFAFIPGGEGVPPETWTTIPWNALQYVHTSTEAFESGGGES